MKNNSKFIKKLVMGLLVSAMACAPVMAASSYEEEMEPNNTMSQADYFKHGQIAKGWIDSEDDVDWWEYRCEENETVRFRLYYLPADYDLKIYDAQGNKLGSSTKTDTSSETITLDLKAGQKYYLKVYSSDGYSATRNYKIEAIRK